MIGNQRVLIAISLTQPPGLADEIDLGLHPRVDYQELATSLGADIVGYRNRKTLPDLAVALECFRRRHSYDVIITLGEAIGIPLATLFIGARRRPRHLMVGHFLSSRKKLPFFDFLHVQHTIDQFFTYSPFQAAFVQRRFAVPAERITRLNGFVDTSFFHPRVRSHGKSGRTVVAAGMESRDYDTMKAAARLLPDIDFVIKASSPWVKGVARSSDNPVPENVQVMAGEVSHVDLRRIYGRADCIVVPLLECEYAAGLTTALEAGSMNVPLIITKTAGMESSLDPTGVRWVGALDPEALADAICSTLDSQPAQNRPWTLAHCSPETWTGAFGSVIDAALSG